MVKALLSPLSCRLLCAVLALVCVCARALRRDVNRGVLMPSIPFLGIHKALYRHTDTSAHARMHCPCTCRDFRCMSLCFVSCVSTPPTHLYFSLLPFAQPSRHDPARLGSL